MDSERLQRELDDRREQVRVLHAFADATVVTEVPTGEAATLAQRRRTLMAARRRHHGRAARAWRGRHPRAVAGHSAILRRRHGHEGLRALHSA